MSSDLIKTPCCVQFLADKSKRTSTFRHWSCLRCLQLNNLELLADKDAYIRLPQDISCLSALENLRLNNKGGSSQLQPNSISMAIRRGPFHDSHGQQSQDMLLFKVGPFSACMHRSVQHLQMDWNPYWLFMRFKRITKRISGLDGMQVSWSGTTNTLVCCLKAEPFGDIALSSTSQGFREKFIPWICYDLHVRWHEPWWA